jgi:hypothetical protein
MTFALRQTATFGQSIVAPGINRSSMTLCGGSRWGELGRSGNSA